jgi:hypothetical protein
MEKIGNVENYRRRRRRSRTPLVAMGPVPGDHVFDANQSHALVVLVEQDLGIPAERILEGIGKKETQLDRKPLKTTEDA